MIKICVITGTRAEYGLLKQLMDKVKNDNDTLLQLIVTGTHLSQEFGYTYDEIQADGFTADETVEIIVSSNSGVGTSKSMGLALISLAETFKRLNPDILVILGDRFEMLSAAVAALNCHIPIAHIHGGETTQGALDEAYRHAISKMSYLHFTSTEIYRKRVIQLGEEPERVFNVGALAMDAIANLQYLNKEELELMLGIEFGGKSALFTYHPVTMEKDEMELQINNILDALNEIPELFIIFTKSNADMGGQYLNHMLEEYVIKNKARSAIFSSLGQQRYMSCMKYCDVIIGNSSSGIIEAPSLKIPTVNIGDRQKGRVKALSVIDCPPYKDAIVRALKRALSVEFKNNTQIVENPYGSDGVTDKIISVIKENINKKKIVRKKKFYDINF
ncbi:MAG: neuC [Anaerocolumna sp.]|jgi:GDP/UDP-N,N'-diacetylbacillosamine 2-epimerase (hydrolysing)|nr:neuC [Anaerocolumna sp.]